MVKFIDGKTTFLLVIQAMIENKVVNTLQN